MDGNTLNAAMRTSQSPCLTRSWLLYKCCWFANSRFSLALLAATMHSNSFSNVFTRAAPGGMNAPKHLKELTSNNSMVVAHRDLALLRPHFKVEHRDSK